MQTTHSATPAQYHPNSNSGLFLVGLLALGAFLFYAVQSHLVTDGFVWILSNFFDSFSIKSNSIFADIALLILFALALFGLFCLFKFFFVATVGIVIISILAAVFLAPDTKPVTLKNVLIHDNRAKESDNVGG